ncbi:MAG: hypothetical protein SVW02_01965 [Candidatus Nanohaloarchaea archaeon]|nr:hypothetical protein [Candidatus Nanohaloarchaea archaeon]
MAGKTYEKQIEKIVNGDGCHANLAEQHLEIIQDWRNQLELDVEQWRQRVREIEEEEYDSDGPTAEEVADMIDD